MDSMPHRPGHAAANGHASAASKSEDKFFLDDEPERERKPVHTSKFGNHDEDNGSKLKLIIGAVIAVVVVLAVLFVASMMMRPSSTTVGIDKNRFQAVFFTNGQVYFGKLKEASPTSMSLTQVFYLQTQNNAADEEDSKSLQATNDQNNANVELIKLGNEIHGPDDEMIISKDQILFFENLKQDGKVAQTITQYQTQKK